MPTIGMFLFLALYPEPILKEKQYVLLLIVFFSTYIIPLVVLLVLKKLALIDSLKVATIKERKIPLFLMLIIFYVLGKLLYAIPNFKELGLLFFGTDLALILIYFLFFFNIKASLHVMSISSAMAFFLIFGSIYSLPILPIIMVFFLLTGILASARLHLKAHTESEIYIGLVLGIVCQFTVFFLF
jgi:hypothetical protein